VSAAGEGSLPQRLAHALRRRTLAASSLTTRRNRGATAAGRRPLAVGAVRLGRFSPRPRVLLAAVAALVLVLAGWFWLRDCSLVAVRAVEVTGVSGAQGTRIRGALEQAGRSMTTLHVRRHALDAAVAPFSLVKRLEVSTDFPHTLRIHVVTNVAVGAVLVGDRRIAVTSDGTLLRDVTASTALPQIFVARTPDGSRLTERAAVAAVEALGAAPEALRTRVKEIATTPSHGLTLQLAHGPVLWFGAAVRFEAKWSAAAAVLADPQAAGASSIDVSAPERPAVGGLPDGATASGQSDLPTLPDTTTTAGAATAPPAPTTTTATTTISP
jgi:cell division protein FtsQ